MEALAVLLGSDVLVAITVTVVGAVTVAGAVYIPFETVPMFGTTDQEADGLRPPPVLTVKNAF